jgi:hypothetical protein
MSLNTYIDSGKTLVITDGEFHTWENIVFADRVFFYNIPEGMLFRYDPQQQEMLRYHIHEKGCSQIIYVSPQHPTWLDAGGNDASVHYLNQSLRFNLSVLLRHQKDNLISPSIRRQMLLELHVIDQCNLLLDYFFIRKKVEDGDLRLKGIVTQLNGDRFKSIFSNGISYNDLLSLN